MANGWGNPRIVDGSVQIYGGLEPESAAIVTGAMHFIGEYDPNKWYDYGAICHRNGSLWICTKENYWEELGESVSVHTYAREIKPVIATNCPNCGAPLYNGHCLYCNTVVFEN